MSFSASEETQSLLRVAQDGDERAVNALLERHRAPLRRMVAARLDPALARRVDASDVVQDVFLDVHRRLPEYLAHNDMPFHLWLRHLALDKLIDAHRRHRVAQRRSLDREQALCVGGWHSQSSLDLAQQIADDQLTPAAAALRQELERRFAEALAQLAPVDREVIVMRHVDRLSNLETAETLGLTAPASAMRYLRAVRRLRAVLGDASAADKPPEASA